MRRDAVAGPLLVQRGPLADTEAVLFVNDGHAEPREAHGRLDQRVRADNQRQLSRRELAPKVGSAGCRCGSGQQADGDELARQERLHGREVLLGQRLGRGHQRTLVAALDRAQERVEGNHRLAGPHLPHQQPLHRSPADQVLADRVNGVLLIGGEREREELAQPALGHFAGAVEDRRRPGSLAPAAAPDQRQLSEQQLVEGEAPASRLGFGFGVWEVSRDERGGPIRQPLGDPQHRAERVDHVDDGGCVLPHEREDLG